ncbi:uncharacterized protein LOC126891204 [Diabrotica virgifera virgifera]|uniref:DDE Tnp4 domain-containing protein n=1 Tax=Diabrotica virgifera virgifera TaxID=50390 RepID=A0ABM5KY23_DIAVI|nr:uncharacterized protein LOC126890262 [Diabrotica virgifera virgifera]XP_050516343.1 uncharacterized protein LOC126891204 [Diabrotica virgifera virgifera]
MAVADSELCFTHIDVGAYGSECDSNVFKKTELGKALYSGTLNLPCPQALITNAPQIDYPYVFVADEAFACSTNVLRPYPAKNTTVEKKIFNYRLSRARRYVECAFGLLANKWRILHRPIDVTFPDVIIQACCVLHNFVRKRDGYNFRDTLTCPLESVSTTGTRGTVDGLTTRDAYAIYFSTEGAVPWQNKMI